MKKLPKIYQNEINKKINNNKTTCYIKNENTKIESMSNQDISKLLDEVFSGIGYSYNIPLTIKTKQNIYNTSLIARTKNNIITLDNDTIPLNEIISITKKKN